MKKNKRLYCVIDACSYIYLKQFRYLINSKELSLFELLSENVVIKHSETVSDEIKRNIKVKSSEAIKISNSIHVIEGKKYLKYDQTLFNSSTTLTNDDKGEKENLMVTIDIFFKQQLPVIYLSDDKKAIGDTGHLKSTIDAFPFCKIWSSFDVINYLLFTDNRKFDSGKAEDAISDIITFIYQPQKEQLMARRAILSNDEYSTKMSELTNKANRHKIEALQNVSKIKNII